jgi:hypothetical protein
MHSEGVTRDIKHLEKLVVYLKALPICENPLYARGGILYHFPGALFTYYLTDVKLPIEVPGYSCS